MLPKICLLFAGGTIGMIQNETTKALQPAKSALEILKKFPEIGTIVDLDFEQIVNIDSSNMTPTHWTRIAQKIHELYDKYDGFVIAQGTDTMAYTASALSFAFQNLSKPIVFTGSLIPLSEIASDGRNNLIYACMTATLDIAEVCLVFANKIIRGNRAKKYHESLTAVFHSPNFPELGELGRPVKINAWCNKRNEKKLKFQPNFDSNISLSKIFPGFNPEIIDKSIERGTHGIIIEGFGPGNLPFLENSLMDKIKKAINLGIPIIVKSQMEKGITNLEAYEAGFLAKEAGAISAKDMTTEATVAKLMWALAQTKDIAEIKEIFDKDLAGEVSVAE